MSIGPNKTLGLGLDASLAVGLGASLAVGPDASLTVGLDASLGLCLREWNGWDCWFNIWTLSPEQNSKRVKSNLDQLKGRICFFTF